MITIDTKSTIYVCTDGTNAEVHILHPNRHGPVKLMGFEIEHLRIDDPDPYGPHGTDAAVFKLLCESDMEHQTFDI